MTDQPTPDIFSGREWPDIAKLPDGLAEILTMVSTARQCVRCIHYKGFPLFHCRAFPDSRIPVEIWMNHVKHDQPYPGDHGIQFEPNPDVPEDFRERLYRKSS